MLCKYNMIVDFARPQKSNTVIVAENDVDSRQCNFRLLFDKEPFDMTGVVQATVTGVKGDQSYVYSPATIVQDAQGNNINELYWVIPGDITEDAGIVTLVIELQDNVGAAISSFEFYVKVRNALYNEDDFISDDSKDGLRDLISRMTAALQSIEEMITENELPNPYPIRFTIDGVEYEYTGAAIQTIELDNVAYLGDAVGLVEVTEDDSAAQIAVAAAESCAESLAEVTSITNEFESKIPTASVTKSGDTSTITITDQNGTTTASVDDGETGATPNITAVVTVDSNIGTPACTVTKTGTDENPTLTFAFTNLKGQKGDTGSGSSVEWGEIYGDNLEAQADLASYIEGKNYNKITRTGITASADGTIRIPASGTDSRISTANTCVVRPISENKSDGTPYKFRSCVVSDGYATITVAEAIASPGIEIGVEVINY